METIPITNFAGRLTRILNGDLNSGFAKFSPSFGYDPFTKPMNLTWLEQATDITGPINNLPQDAKVLSGGLAGSNVHILDQGGRWYQIATATLANNNTNSVVGIASVAGSYLFGTSMRFFGSVVGADLVGNRLGKLFVGGDTAIRSVNPDGSADAVVGNTNAYIANVYRPIKEFAGKLIFGNGNTVGQIDSTGTVTSPTINIGTNASVYSALNPPLETSARVLDIDVSENNDYVVIASSDILQSERLDITASDIITTFASGNGRLNRWNGIDAGITAATNVPSYLLSEIHTYFNTESFFGNDTFGAALNSKGGKQLTLPNNKAPLPNAVSLNGSMLTFACPESVSGSRYLSLYYYGQLDEENPKGLYRVLRWATTQASGFVSKVPLNIIVSNLFNSINSAVTALRDKGYGKHYLGVSSVNSSATVNFLLNFFITSTGTGTPQLGVYETQTQLFSKRKTVKQIRVYTEPTVASNGFQIDCIGSDGNVLTNGTSTYTFAAGTDLTLLQGALERIDFNPAMQSTFALGIRITNTGSVNMTIKKIEVDIEDSGK